jgi:hypothetical protein
MKPGLYLALILGIASAAASAQSNITPLTAPDFARIAPRLHRSRVAHLSGSFQPDRKQSFAVSGTGFSTFSLVPIHFEAPVETGGSDVGQCGVFIVPAEGETSYVGTLGTGNREPEICSDLLGVGFMPAAAGPPRIILLYDGGSFNYPGKDPVILDWNATAKRYVSNDKLVDSIKSPASIPAIKAQLKAAHPVQ